ncbi:Receptor-like serine/threonine-protein kinase SD1-8 [Dichanthelium oligosanthes]|uniref:Receptor-like serine/threonine-protein kinase SD1-8 n=1 Tax=Dichanthelium oligosanthes TaxID=888268 RepID=A0A1E5VIX5_9POAL|nr:Receptor-like serine/threonine-protein kinase SD1-8 [Dichanthelium oligosanthes]
MSADSYALCGAFGLCNVDTASTLFCRGIDRFSAALPSLWSMRETSGGCRRDVPLECGNGTTTDGFRELRRVKLPDTDNATADLSAAVEQCRARYFADCSCADYAAADIQGGGDGSGCVMWADDIVDVRYIDKGQDLYVRLAKSELVTTKSRNVVKILLTVVACLLSLTGIFLVWIWCKLRGTRTRATSLLGSQNDPEYNTQNMMVLGCLDASDTLGDENLDLPFFTFREIVSATNNFAEDNMLGQGGCGVYKERIFFFKKRTMVSSMKIIKLTVLFNI